MNNNSSLLRSIGQFIKSKMSLGSTPTPTPTPTPAGSGGSTGATGATATNTQSIQNIDFEQIKSSFMNIEGSIDKLNDIFEGIHTDLQAVLNKNAQQQYADEENRLEARPRPEPRSRDNNKDNKSSFFDNLKSLFMNPAVIAALAGLVYSILPEETQKKIKAILGGFADGVDKSTDGFSKLSTTTKVVGIGLATYLGSKLIRNVADAISSVMGMINAIGRMGKFGKAAAIGALGATAFAVTKAVTGESKEEKPVDETKETSTVLTKEEVVPTGKEADKTDEAKSENVTVSGQAPPTAAGGATAETKPTPSASQPAPAPSQGGTPAPTRAQRMEAAAQGKTALPSAPPVAIPSSAPMGTTPTSKAPTPKVPVTKPSVAATAPSTTNVGKLLIPSDTVGKAIESASKRVGVDKSIMMAMAKQESGFNPQAKAGTSSASGLFQFISSTWDGMVKKYSGSFPELYKGPMDVDASSIAGALYIKENSDFLKRNNIPVNGTTIYASHFLGAGGARTLLSSPPDAIAANIMPKAAAANKNIFYKKDKSARTVAEVQEVLYNKVGKEAEKYAALDSNTPTQVAMAPTPIPTTPTETSVSMAPTPGPVAETKPTLAATTLASNSDGNTPPPQLGMDATDAELADNYRKKAKFFQAQSDKAKASGNLALAEEYQKEVPVYEGYAARREALAASATPVQSAKVSKGTQIASLSTKNEAMASPKPMAPQIQNASSTKNVGVNGNSGKATPNEIPIPIANRGSLSGNVRHATQYA